MVRKIALHLVVASLLCLPAACGTVSSPGAVDATAPSAAPTASPSAGPTPTSGASPAPAAAGSAKPAPASEPGLDTLLVRAMWLDVVLALRDVLKLERVG